MDEGTVEIYTDYMQQIMDRGARSRLPEETVAQAAQREYITNVAARLPDLAEWPRFFRLFIVMLDPECEYGVPLCPQPYLTVPCPVLGPVEPPGQRGPD